MAGWTNNSSGPSSVPTNTQRHGIRDGHSFSCNTRIRNVGKSNIVAAKPRIPTWTAYMSHMLPQLPSSPINQFQPARKVATAVVKWTRALEIGVRRSRFCDGIILRNMERAAKVARSAALDSWVAPSMSLVCVVTIAINKTAPTKSLYRYPASSRNSKRRLTNAINKTAPTKSLYRYPASSFKLKTASHKFGHHFTSELGSCFYYVLFKRR